MTCKRSFWFFGFVRCGYRDGGVGGLAGWGRERGRRPRIEFVRELAFGFDAAEGGEEELADVGERGSGAGGDAVCATAVWRRPRAWFLEDG